MRGLLRVALALVPLLVWAPGLYGFVPESWVGRMAIMLGAWGLAAASFACERIDRENFRRDRGLDEPTALHLNRPSM